MSEQSVTDLSVAGLNAPMFELLWRLPGDLVLDFLERANGWELRHALSGRVARTAEFVRSAVERTPELRDRAEHIGRDCAEFAIGSNAPLCALASQWERGSSAPLTVEWHGVDNLRRPAVIFAPHMGFLYAVPLALAVRGNRSAVLGGVEAQEALPRVVAAVAPELRGRIDYLAVPDPGCARAALGTLARGELLVIFPEVNRGATGNVQSATTTFLGRTIWLPTTAARFARMAGADIVPALVLPDGPRRVRVEFGTPVPAPRDRHGDVATSVALFAWLQRAVLDHPHLWWGWPMLDADMAVTGPRTPAADRT